MRVSHVGGRGQGGWILECSWDLNPGPGTWDAGPHCVFTTVPRACPGLCLYLEPMVILRVWSRKRFLCCMRRKTSSLEIKCVLFFTNLCHVCFLKHSLRASHASHGRATALRESGLHSPVFVRKIQNSAFKKDEKCFPW